MAAGRAGAARDILDSAAGPAAMAWCLAIASDWLTSSAAPFPYAAALAYTLTASLPLAAILARRPVATTAEGAPRGPLVTALAGLAAVAPAIAVATAAALVRPVGEGGDTWIVGAGLGSAMPLEVANHPAARFCVAWGAAALWCLAALLLISGLCAAFGFRAGRTSARISVAGVALTWLSVAGLWAGYGWALHGCSIGAALCIRAFPAGRPAAAGRVRSTGPVRRRRVRRIAVAAACAALLLGGSWLYTVRVVAQRLAEALPRAAPLESISPAMVDVTIAMEDRGFYRHAGFSLPAMHAALRQDVREGRIAAGGSTITQQLAKLLFLGPERTPWRKIRELALALELERRLSKRQILALYLDQVDYGMGRRGIRAAAQGYFHKQPAALGLAEAALLAGYGPRPPLTDAQAASRSDQRQVVLARLQSMPHRSWTDAEIGVAASVPLDHLAYPWRAALDRGATAELPAEASGIGLWAWLRPGVPTPAPWAAPALRAAYLRAAPRLARLGVTGIEHLGLFSDRGTRANPAALSAHAYGLALDIRAFTMRDGRRVAAANHDMPADRPLLLRLAAELRRDFDVVVDWRDDPVRHKDHFHVEMRRPTGGGADGKKR